MIFFLQLIIAKCYEFSFSLESQTLKIQPINAEIRLYRFISSPQ